jgi:hypothetical protein
MKVAAINCSGNVGKTTVARHLLAPRIEGAEVIAIESTNADGVPHRDALRAVAALIARPSRCGRLHRVPSGA